MTENIDGSTNPTEEDMLHYGRLGMKWGVRNSRGGYVGTHKAKKPQASSDWKKINELRKKPVSSLSNKQLKAINDRMNMETNYKRMSPSKMSKGKKFVTEALAVGTMASTAYALAKSPAAKAAMNAGKAVVSKASFNNMISIP